MTKAIATAYGRVGLLGNPSDMYGGKCIGFTFDRRAEVEIDSVDRVKGDNEPLELRIEGNGIVEDLELRVMHDGILVYNLQHNRGNEVKAHDLIKATLNHVRPGLSLKKKVDITYKSDIPVGAGLAGSSAIIIATLRALKPVGLHDDNYNFHVAELATYTEIDELGIACGFQDRYVISFGGVCYMDFEGKEFMRKTDSYGKVAGLDIDYIPCFLALSKERKSSAGVHNPLRERFLNGSVQEQREIKDKMDEIALLAEEGKKYLLDRDWERVGELMNSNHELRRGVGLSRSEDEEIVDRALKFRALGAKVAGSGGAVVVLTDIEDNYWVYEKMSKEYECFKPIIVGGVV